MLLSMKKFKGMQKKRAEKFGAEKEKNYGKEGWIVKI